MELAISKLKNSVKDLQALNYLKGSSLWYQVNERIEDYKKAIDLLESMKNVNRPIVEHKHTKGEWKPLYLEEDNRDKVIYSYLGLVKNFICKINTSKEEIANAKLIAASPQLLQVSEMYFDRMKSANETDTIPFKITSKILNGLQE